jgi:hypothetical protein
MDTWPTLAELVAEMDAADAALEAATRAEADAFQAWRDAAVEALGASARVARSRAVYADARANPRPPRREERPPC